MIYPHLTCATDTKNVRVVFYCESEKCSAASDAAKKTVGPSKGVFILDGGLQAWKKAGRPTEPYKAP